LVRPRPRSSTGTGVSSPCSRSPAKTWARSASISGTISAEAQPTQSASVERSIRESPRIVGVEARKTFRRWAKVSDRASASDTGSPSSSTEAG
jgi:hypothetical protein